MPDAQSNAAQMGFAQESTYGGTIPTAPLKLLRFTDESLGHMKNAQWSNEIDANGDRASVIDISKSSAGGFTSELSFLDFVTWLPAAMGAGNGVTVSGTTSYTNANALKSFYFEKQFTDISALIGAYGMVISEFSLTLTANDIARVTFGFMGQYLKKEGATRGSATPTAKSRDQVIRSGVDVSNLYLNGAPAGISCRSLTLKWTRNVRPKTEIMAGQPTGHNAGSFDCDGSGVFYFPSMALFDKCMAHEAQSLSFRLGNQAGRFDFELPAIQLANVSPNIGSINQDVMQEIPFLATRGDDSKAYTVKLGVTPVP